MENAHQGKPQGISGRVLKREDFSGSGIAL